MRDHLKARNDPGAAALFVSHAKTRPKHRGRPLSASKVWRMVQRTAKALRLPHGHPQDFRHRRATQKLAQGVPVDQAGLWDQSRYFHTHKRRMRYHDFREEGLPIGFGTVESAIKQFKVRLTGPGMRWSRAGAHRMIAVRQAAMGGSIT